MCTKRLECLEFLVSNVCQQDRQRALKKERLLGMLVVDPSDDLGRSENPPTTAEHPREVWWRGEVDCSRLPNLGSGIRCLVKMLSSKSKLTNGQNLVGLIPHSHMMVS